MPRNDLIVVPAEKLAALRAALETGKLGNSSDFAASLLHAAVRYDGLTPKQFPWIDKLLERVANADKPAEGRETAEVGDLSAINALFDKARNHLKRPAIVLSVGADDDGVPYLIRLSVAGSNARVPGSINVTEWEVDDGLWYGRILKSGVLEISPKVTNDDTAKENVAHVTGLLREFAADPVAVASAHGRLTGKCCFCHKGLKDERSTGIGYGPVCAENYGLAWGARPAQFAEAV